MKKVLCYILIFAMLICTLPLAVSAEEKAEDQNIVLNSPIVHPQRGQETIVIKKHMKYLQMFRYEVYFEIILTEANGEITKYTSECFRVGIFNKDDATIETLCDHDDNIKALYPHIYKVGLNKESEALMKKALSSQDALVDKLLKDPIEAWYKAEKESICQDAVLSSITANAGFNESLQNCIDLGFTLFDVAQDAITEEGPEEITGDTEEERAFKKTVNFAKKAQYWLQVIWDNIWIILDLQPLTEDGAIVDFESAVSPQVEKAIDAAIKTAMDKEELEYHDAVYTFLKGK